MGQASHFVTFELDGVLYALYLSVVQLVIRAVEITALPAAPDCIAGIINFHGQIVPVFNLRCRFELPLREQQINDIIILARTTQRLVALTADAIGDVVTCADSDITPAEALMPGTSYLEGVATPPERLILIHDLNAFLSLDEEKTLEKALASA